MTSTRLATRVGILRAAERSAESLDVVLFHEPKVGSVMRTKGSLFVLAQVTGSDAAIAGAARQAAEWLQHEYYYDLSAGVLGVLTRAVRTVNRRLFQTRARLGIPRRGGIGLIAMVIQGGHAHVVKLGPASGVVIRDERMYEIPPPPAVRDEDPRLRHRRVAATLGEALEIEPFSWRGEVTAGDRLALVSRNLAEVVGTDDLRVAILDARPAAAVEHLGQLFGVRGGAGSDGVLIVELVEVPLTEAARPLQPVYPNDQLAGLPDASPVPLADALGRALVGLRDRVAAIRRGLGVAATRTFGVFLAFMPRRRATYPRRVSRTAVREADRRRRTGLVGMVAVAVLVAAGATARNAAGPSPTEAIPRTAIAREAIADAEEHIEAVESTVDGATLVDRAPDDAEQLLTSAARALERASAAGVTTGSLAPLRSRVDAGLDRLYHVTRLGEIAALVDLGTIADDASGIRMVAASDGSLWLLDAGGRVERVDPADGSVSVIVRSGEEVEGGAPGDPWLLTTAATDVVVIDRQHQSWRIDLTERIPRRMELNGEGALDDEMRLLGSVQHRPPLEIFTLYAVDPASGQILKWTPPAVIPVNYPDPPVSFLTDDPDLPSADARDILVDVNLWLLHASTVTRVNFGTPLAQFEYSLDPPPDSALRPTLDYRLLAAATVGERELFYVYDAASSRIVAFNRGDGSFVRQWMAPGGPYEGLLDDVRGLVVSAVGEGPPAAYVLIADRVVRIVLE
ncbi:MAG: hypothetical protein ABR509_06395 [Candidatus Limnocylindria bacterium]